MVNKKRVSKVLVFVLLIGTLLSSVAFAADTKDYVIDKDIKISAKAHIQSFGDRSFETDDKGVLEFGTTGKAKRLEEFALKLEGAPKDMAIEYRVHGQSYGDMPAEADKWIRGDKEIGSRGKAKRIEGIQIRLVNTETGKAYEGYSVEYQVHMQSFGWGVNKTDKGDVWAKDGEFAGTKGLSKRLEAVRVRIKKEDELKVKAADAISAKALKVTFNKPVKDVNKVMFSAKRDGAVVNFAKVTWNDAKTEATLEVSYKLFAGKYVVIAKVGDVELASDEFTVEDEKIAKISFNSDKAVLDSNATSITTGIKVENQYGQDITNNYSENTLKIISSRGNVDSLNNGVVKINAPSEQKFAVDEKVVVTVVDNATGTTATQTLTSVAAVDIAAIEIGDVTTEEKVKEIYVGTELSTKDYWLPLIVKDQYGNEITDLDTLKDNLTLLTSDKNIVDELGANNIVTKNKKPAIKLKDGADTAKAGKVTITVVSKSGKSASKVIEVLADAKTDVFTVQTPEAMLKAGKETVLPFTAVDTYGNALVKAENGLATSRYGVFDNSLILGSGDNQTKIDITNGQIAASIDYINNNKLVLKVKPMSADQKMVIVVTTPTAKVQTLTLTVQAAPTAKTIAGLKAGFYTAIQEGQDASVALTDIVTLKDQYGDAAGLGENKLEIESVDDANQNIVLTGTEDGKKKFTATAGKNGTAQFKVTLKDNSNKLLDTLTFTMENVALKDITQFAIKDMGKFYTGTEYFTQVQSGEYDKTLAIEGKKADGTKVLVDPKLVKGATVTAPIKLDIASINADGTVKVLNSANNTVDTKGADKTAIITFTIEGAEAPITVTKELVYSSAKPVAQSLKVVKTANKAVEIAAPVVEEDASNFNGEENNTTFAFLAKDQYGVETKELNYTITNKNIAEDASVSIDSSGAITASGLEAGDSFVITATIDGLVKTLKVIVK